MGEEAGTLEGLMMQAANDYDGLDERVRERRLRAELFGICAEPVRVGRYIVDRELAAGAMGVVFLATDPTLEREVVLKTVHPVAREIEPYRVRLVREGLALARLSHPNVVHVYDAGIHEDELYVAMEYIDGPSLARWGRACPRSWSEVLAVYMEAAAGLAAAHSADVVHGDFKPSNAVIAQDGQTKVVDFGLARLDERVAGTPPPGIVGDRSGTPSFMSPEQRHGGHADARSDQYAWGASLGMTLLEGGPAGSAHNQLDRLPRQLRAVVARCTHDDPGQRWPSMDCVLLELQRVLARRRRRPWLMAGGAALAGATAMLAMAVRQHEPPREDTGDLCANPRTQQAQLTRAWDDTKRDELRQAFRGSVRGHAPWTGSHVEQELDQYADRWSKTATQVCEKPTNDGGDERRRSQLCLLGRLAELGALADHLAEADDTVIDRAMRAVGELSEPRQCLDVISERFGDTTSPQITDAIDRIARARALVGVGSDELAAQHLAQVLDGLPTTGAEAIEARGMLTLGDALKNLSRYPEAEEVFVAALPKAEVAGDPNLAAQIRAKLIVVLGRYQARPDAALTTARLLARDSDAAADPNTQARLFDAIGLAHQAAGAYDEALKWHRKAVQAGEATGRPLAVTLTNLAIAMSGAGRSEEALPLVERAAGLVRNRVGPQHPELAKVYANMGGILLVQRRPQQARARLEEAIRIWEINYGAQHPAIAHPSALLGRTLRALQLHDEAWAALDRALQLDEVHDELGANRGRALLEAARVRAALNDPMQAEAYARRAIDAAPAGTQGAIDEAEVRSWMAQLRSI